MTTVATVMSGTSDCSVYAKLHPAMRWETSEGAGNEWEKILNQIQNKQMEVTEIN